MASSYRRWAIFGQLADPRVRETAVLLAGELGRRRLELLIDQADPGAAAIPQARMLSQAELLDSADLLLAIGGDGTLLKAAGVVGARGLPVLGINRGRLGFLTDVMPQDLSSSIDAVLGGHCATDRRRLIEARLTRADGSAQVLSALNDVVLVRRETGRMLDFETWVDGRQLNAHSGDGLIIATATGSTAYALSCGGPIVDPRLNVLVLAPICPHALADRPIVIPGDSTVEVRLLDRGEGRAELSCDATEVGDLSPSDRLEVNANGQALTLLHPPGYDYFKLLRSKLHWGRGEQSHER